LTQLANYFKGRRKSPSEEEPLEKQQQLSIRKRGGKGGEGKEKHELFLLGMRGELSQGGPRHSLVEKSLGIVIVMKKEGGEEREVFLFKI